MPTHGSGCSEPGPAHPWMSLMSLLSYSSPLVTEKPILVLPGAFSCHFEQPKLSQPVLAGKEFHPLNYFLWPSNGHTTKSPCLSCTQNSISGCIIPGEIWPVQCKSFSLVFWPCFFWCSPGKFWLSKLWGHTAGSCAASYLQVTSSTFCQGCSLSFQPPASTDSCDPGATPSTWICWILWCSPGPCLGLSQWHHIPNLSPSEPSAWRLCVEQSLLKSEAKMSLSISAFSMYAVTSLPLLLTRGGKSFRTFVFQLMYLWKPFLSFFVSLDKSSSS